MGRPGLIPPALVQNSLTGDEEHGWSTEAGRELQGHHTSHIRKRLTRRLPDESNHKLSSRIAPRAHRFQLR
jgi:hypothetical protein